MAVNSICWKMPSRFRFYSAKSERKVRVQPYLIEFNRLLESSITVIEGVRAFDCVISLLKMNLVLVTKDSSQCLHITYFFF